MSLLRVVRIPYLNSVPFYQRLEGAEFRIADLSPRRLGAAAQAGAADAGIMSMCDALRSREFEPLGAMGVSCDGPAHSVLLLSQVQPRGLSGATIAVTSETSTSYPLLRLLLEQHFEVRPRAYVRRPDGPQPGDGATLLIGDPALVAAARAGVQPGAVDYSGGLLRLPQVDARQPWKWALDLSAVWRSWQRLPFVFARWMVRTDADPVARDRLLHRLDESLQWSLHNLRSLAAANAARGGLTDAGAFAYLMGFNYRLGTQELRAIERFHTLLAGSPWWQDAEGQALQESGT